MNALVAESPELVTSPTEVNKTKSLAAPIWGIIGALMTLIFTILELTLLPSIRTTTL